MESLNRIELIGKVGNSNITRIGDTEVLRMSVATTYGYESKDGSKIYETTWHNVTAWKGENVTAETIYGIGKGTDVRVVGRLRAIRFTDSDGNDRTTYEVFANEIEIVK